MRKGNDVAANQKVKNSVKKEIEGELLYKSREIRHFEIRGMFYRSDLKRSDEGSFVGYVICEDNSHDKYAVAVYKEGGKMLGYTPRNNKRLNDSLRKWHNGKLFCWGLLEFDEYQEKWGGGVYIPVGLPDYELNAIKRINNLNKELSSVLSFTPTTTEQNFRALEINQEINFQFKIIDKPKGLLHFFPKTIIPSLSKKLEKDKQWSELVRLEQFKEEIDNLSDKFMSTTYKRIERAKRELAEENKEVED